jgi:3,4-dihydroxy 2-butanone 4-phosphate synthase/GTP cyclohydrolase II
MPVSSATTDVAVALDRLAAGGMAVVADDVGHPWGALVVAAEHVTAGAVNAMARHARGVMYLAITGERCEQLGLGPMSRTWEGDARLSLAVSIEARDGTSTGISAADRARTVRTAIRPQAVAADVVSPGHVFPLRVADGGTLERPACAEAAVDLVRACGLAPAALVCGILDEDGDMAWGAALEGFCAEHDVPLVSVRELLAEPALARPR